jgi:hypothetical protein
MAGAGDALLATEVGNSRGTGIHDPVYPKIVTRQKEEIRLFQF